MEGLNSAAEHELHARSSQRPRPYRERNVPTRPALLSSGDVGGGLHLEGPPRRGELRRLVRLLPGDRPHGTPATHDPPTTRHPPTHHQHHHRSCPSPPQILASGSDDGTARVWDPRTGKAVRCIAAFGKGAAVTNVAWAPNSGPLPSSLWASTGADVYCFDLRAGGPILVREPCLRLSNVLGPDAADGDEIASLCVHPKTGATVAAADDSGAVHLLQLAVEAPPPPVAVDEAAAAAAAADAATGAEASGGGGGGGGDGGGGGGGGGGSGGSGSGEGDGMAVATAAVAAMTTDDDLTVCNSSSMGSHGNRVRVSSDTTLEGGHSTVCTAAVFRPGCARDLSSGGLDGEVRALAVPLCVHFVKFNEFIAKLEQGAPNPLLHYREFQLVPTKFEV